MNRNTLKPSLESKSAGHSHEVGTSSGLSGITNVQDGYMTRRMSDVFDEWMDESNMDDTLKSTLEFEHKSFRRAG